MGLEFSPNQIIRPASRGTVHFHVQRRPDGDYDVTGHNMPFGTWETSLGNALDRAAYQARRACARVMRVDLDVADYGAGPMPRMNEAEELAITAAVMSACREVQGETSGDLRAAE